MRDYLKRTAREELSAVVAIRSFSSFNKAVIRLLVCVLDESVCSR